jgi:hypothetical protein
MGELVETKTVTYWTACFKWKVIPYPCRKKKEVEIWCYEFDWIKRAGKFLLRVTYQGCEAGVLHEWKVFAIGSGGEEPEAGQPPFSRCFQGKRKEVGSCPAGPIEIS